MLMSIVLSAHAISRVRINTFADLQIGSKKILFTALPLKAFAMHGCLSELPDRVSMPVSHVSQLSLQLSCIRI
jgi:hypothetical protein